MASRRLVSLVVILVTAGTSNATFTFDDITYWVGSGSNRAGFVVDWNGGKNPVSLAWGYKWDGTATGKDMLTAIAGTDNLRDSIGGTIIETTTGADERLYVEMVDWGWGISIFGLGYDIDNDGFAYVFGDDETGHAGDSDDHYKEGWSTSGYWSYWGSSDGVSWDYPGIGFDGHTLSNGGWEGWSFAAAPDWNLTPPDEPAAAEVPEPMTIVLFGLGGLLVRKLRKSRSV